MFLLIYTDVNRKKDIEGIRNSRVKEKEDTYYTGDYRNSKGSGFLYIKKKFDQSNPSKWGEVNESMKRHVDKITLMTSHKNLYGQEGNKKSVYTNNLCVI